VACILNVHGTPHAEKSFGVTVLPVSPPMKAYPRQQPPPAAGARTNPSAATSNVPLHVALHVPFEQVPVHGRLQPPQWALLLFVSTQALLQSISGDEQTQLLLTHVAPDGQRLPHAPQFAASFVRLAHAPPEHCV